MASIWFLGAALLAGWTSSPDARVRLAWSDAEGLAPYAALIRREVASILGASGVAVAWSDAVEPSRDAPADRVTVVLTASSPSGAGWGLPPTAMGAYLDSGRSSAIFVFHRRVAEVVGVRESTERLLTLTESRAMARALARVIVHEMVHRISPDQPHAPRGVMRARLDRHALTRPRLRLDADSARALLAALRPSSEKTASIDSDDAR